MLIFFFATSLEAAKTSPAKKIILFNSNANKSKNKIFKLNITKKRQRKNYCVMR